MATDLTSSAMIIWARPLNGALVELHQHLAVCPQALLDFQAQRAGTRGTGRSIIRS